MRHGQETHFELCPVDACPKVTPKTLAKRAQAIAVPSADAPSSLPAAGTATRTLVERTSASTPLRAMAETSRPPVVPIKTTVITFASGSALVTAAAKRQLEAILPEVQRSPVIHIRGRTDELGSVALNDVLARNRALAVRDYLRTQDLAEATTIHVSAKGACCYVADNDTQEGRAANRRVEIEYQPTLQLAQGTPHEPH